jgi:hypothetical protein
MKRGVRNNKNPGSSKYTLPWRFLRRTLRSGAPVRAGVHAEQHLGLADAVAGLGTTFGYVDHIVVRQSTSRRQPVWSRVTNLTPPGVAATRL